MLRFVKLVAYYWMDEKVAAGDDAAEVMFLRGMSWCAGSGTAGRIPTAIVPQLTRRPSTAARTARGLVDRGLWTTVSGGYQIAAWDHHNDALDGVEERRRRDRERKREARAAAAASGGAQAGTRPRTVRGQSDGRPTNVPPAEIEEEVDAAAAAPDAAAAAGLHPTLAVLRSKLQQHTPLRALRFDTLTDAQTAQLVALVELHGDARLAKVALDTCRTPPPVHVSAFLGTWSAMPPPGRRLAPVPNPPAVERGRASDEAIASARSTALGRRTQEDQC